MSWHALDTFEVPHLLRALGVVEEQHPKILDPEDRDWSTDLERLRALLAETPDAHVAALVTRLRRRELLLAVDLALVEAEPKIATRAVILAGAARMKDVPSRAWRLLATSGPHAALEEIMRAYADPMWLEKVVVQSDDAARVISWFTAPSLTRGFLAEHEIVGFASVDEWLKVLPELTTSIAPDSPIWPAFWRTLLGEGSARTLRQEGPEELIHRADALGDLAIDEFIVNYVTQFRPGRAWAEKVMDWMARRRGQPKVHAIAGVWRLAEARSPGVVRELANWFALRTLEDFFRSIRDPWGRFQFWEQNFGARLVGAEKLCGGEAAALLFPGIVVVEFGEHGNAAYVYPDSVIPWLKRNLVSNAGDLKDRSKLIRRGGSDYRIIHRGDWQLLERVRMEEVLRDFQQRP